ncbi:MAG: hypothetical protein JRF34_09000, partial [Deltaproteobacteria bacterium]|nr:hypothetical protein [Deltaproteobacteria bacterium]
RSQEELTKIEDIVKRAVNFDAERGDEIEVRNIPFEINKAMEDREETVEQGWLSTLQKYSEYLRYAFLVVFLFLSFLFVVRPIVRWLTAAPAGGGEMLKQLPMTVEEIERGYGEGSYSLPFRDKAKNMLLGEDEASLTIAKEWLSEQ